MPKIKSQTPERPIVYDKYVAKVCVGNSALTVENAKKLLGWEEETDKIKFGGDYLLTDVYGRKVRCNNNAKNRPFNEKNAEKIKQDILRKRWRCNGEAPIIGKYGTCISAQHRLIALVFASQTWEKDKDTWSEFWASEPTLETFINFGVNEDDETVNTIDTGEPRSLSDVLYRCDYFSDMRGPDREKISGYAANAIKLLWLRTGVDESGMAPYRTHSESIDFIDHHPKLLECVKHVYEENGGAKKISEYVSLGYAAALLYLMGSSQSKYHAYKNQNPPQEASLDWGLWDTACDFWILLASDDKRFSSFYEYFSSLQAERGQVTNPERWALLIKAWKAFSNNEKITTDTLILDFAIQPDGASALEEKPVLGGIDVYDGEIPAEEGEETEEQPQPKGKANTKATANGKAKKPFAVGDAVWVEEEDGNYDGTLVEVYDGRDWKVAKVKNRSKKVLETAYANLRRDEP